MNVRWKTSRAASEEPIFGRAGANNEVLQTRFSISGIHWQTSGGGWASNTRSSVSMLSKLSGHAIGRNSLLKVMAGDTINAKTNYYYPAAVTNNNNSLDSDIVAGFIDAITVRSFTSNLLHGNTTNINNTLNSSPPFAGITDPNLATGDQIPRAYINVIFFETGRPE